MNAVLCLLCIMLVPLAAAGLALIHQGLGRSRSAAHAMLAILCALGISAIVFVIFGFSWAGFPGGARPHLHSSAKSIGIGSAPHPSFPAAPISALQTQSESTARSSLCLEMFAAGLAAMIPLSAGTDRWRLGAWLFRQRHTCRLHLSSLRPLGMGRRLARPARNQLSASQDSWTPAAPA